MGPQTPADPKSELLYRALIEPLQNLRSMGIHHGGCHPQIPIVEATIWQYVLMLPIDRRACIKADAKTGTHRAQNTATMLCVFVCFL